jgi:hypothetical protein
MPSLHTALLHTALLHTALLHTDQLLDILSQLKQDGRKHITVLLLLLLLGSSCY